MDRYCRPLLSGLGRGVPSATTQLGCRCLPCRGACRDRAPQPAEQRLPAHRECARRSPLSRLTEPGRAGRREECAGCRGVLSGHTLGLRPAGIPDCGRSRLAADPSRARGAPHRRTGHRDKTFYQARYVLPSALDGRTCAVGLALDWSVEWLRNPPAIERGENLQPWLLEQLGPCLYHSAFGQPGPQIEEWLRARSYHLANVADWDGPPPTLRLLEEPNALDLVVSEMSFDALACADGRLPRCRSAISNDRYWQPTGVRLKSSEISGYLRRTYWPRNFLGEDR